MKIVFRWGIGALVILLLILAIAQPFLPSIPDWMVWPAIVLAIVYVLVAIPSLRMKIMMEIKLLGNLWRKG